jgi:hypothetical protein
MMGTLNEPPQRLNTTNKVPKEKIEPVTSQKRGETDSGVKKRILDKLFPRKPRRISDEAENKKCETKICRASKGRRGEAVRAVD